MGKILGSFFSLIFVFSLSVAVFAQNTNSTIPEKNGDYAVPGRPDLRVRVFVHEPKSAKPTPTQSPSLVCGLPDPNSTAVIPPTGWHLPSSWTYALNTNSVPLSVGSNNLSAIAGNAFSTWMNAVFGKVNISQSGTTSINRAKLDRQNIIAWGRTSASALAVTTTWYYPSTGLVAENDTIFNKQYPWFWNSSNITCTDSNSYDAQDILTHETGHWMGLNDTYDAAYIHNTMFGYGSKGEVKKDTLTTGDIQGVQAIYP